MTQPLQGLHVVEGASFIAAPSCGLYLSQLGAEVIRFDMIGGGPDFTRWPRAPGGASLYWEGLNKGKKSIAIDLKRPEGRELAIALATSPGEGRGIFLTNFPATGPFAYPRLADKRKDLIVLRVMGRSDGETALDYTVNSAVGIPMLTGDPSSAEPVNHVLPAWDLTAGAYAAFSLLAADRYRQRSGIGQEVRVSLSDIAVSTVANLGQVAEVAISGEDRPRYGNDVFGAFGRDFLTADKRRIMLVAITPRQWSGLLKALGIEHEVAVLEREHKVSFDTDEGMRFRHRDALNAIVARAVAARRLDELCEALRRHGACWGPYRTLREALASDPDFSLSNPLFGMVSHPSGHSYLTPTSAASFEAIGRQAPQAAPRLGQHTEEVLARYLGLPLAEIGRLHDAGIVQSHHA